MRRFLAEPSSSDRQTNGSPPAPTPPIFEHIKQGLTTIHPQVNALGALAASTSAIALSIGSPSCDVTDITLDERGSSKQSRWTTAYEAAKIALDVANASSDMCLPLKAVVGALSVLIKNYDQTTDNADQISGIEERAQSLEKRLGSPVGDRDDEEKARREVLRKKLDSIIAKLRPLSEQHGIVKFLKNTSHAKTLNGFVRDLDTAVTDYQTSLQQNTYENTNKIGEDTQHIYEEIQTIIEAADLELLGKLDPVHNAGYQAGHHDECLPGTRESVLNEMMGWARNPQDRHVFWLNGLAGTGKSTIAQTFSGMAAEAGTLGASFFCSRDYLDRKELKNIFPTLAYQLACRYHAFRNQIIRVIKRDPSVARNSLVSQLKDLIVGPLSSTNISCIVVVDALDECVDDQPASALLSVLGRHVKDLPSVNFFITGRPEPRIRTGFRLPLLVSITQIFLLHEVELPDVDKDIQLYLQEKLTTVAKRRSDLDVSDPWPCSRDLTALTKKSSGLFIFASTLVRFIESEHHDPNERLQLIVTQPDSTVHEGGAGIDPLYAHILEHAFSGIKETTVFTNLRRVLGTVILAFNPLSRKQIAQILGVSARIITTTLRHLHSVLLVPNEDSKEIRVFHKSFPDFLQDRDRCSDSRFLIDTPTHHGDMALGCLELLKSLKPNPCDLPDFVMNRDVPNIKELLEDKVGSAVRYACGYWAMHVSSSPTTGDYPLRLIASATEFFKANPIQWIEVMSLEDRLESVIHSIHNLFDWFGTVDVSTSDLRRQAEDYLRFTKNFFHIIQQSARHIYHSALPLSPRLSTFHSMILREETQIAEYYGRPETWGIVVQTIRSGTCMTTFGTWIAVACSDGVVRIYHAATGALRLSLGPMDAVEAVGGSPDGSTLFCAHQENSMTLWDIQTGGSIRDFTLTEGVQHIAVSLKGRYLACRVSSGSIKVWEVASVEGGTPIWNSPSSTPFCWVEPERQLVTAGRVSVHIWDVVAGSIVRSFAVVNQQDGSGSNRQKKGVETEGGKRISGVAYSQVHDRLAVITQSKPPQNTLTIIHLRAATILASLDFQEGLSCFTFSRTSEELVCGVRADALSTLDLSTRRWRHLKLPPTVKYVSSLPNGTIAVDSGNTGVQLLSLDNQDTRPSQSTLALAMSAFDQGRIITSHSTTDGSIQLLEASTMSNLITIPASDNSTNPLTSVLCASLKNRMVVRCLQRKDNVHLQLYEFLRWTGEADGPPPLRWSQEAEGRPSVCGISPAGTRIVTVTFHESRHAASICLRGAKDGRVQAELSVDGFNSSPLHITFDSETRFYSHHNNYRVPYGFEIGHWGHTHTIIRHEQQPWTVESSERRYEVDSSREWVVSGSERICWVPQGYIRSTEDGYLWVGSDDLVMLGEDGVLRKLTFSSQEHDSVLER